jgi:hypothetical protein
MRARVVNASLFLLVAAACGGSISRQGQEGGSAGSAGYGNYAGDPVVYDGSFPPMTGTGTGGGYPTGAGGSTPYPYGGYGGDIIGSGGIGTAGFGMGEAGIGGEIVSSGGFGVGGLGEAGMGGDVIGSGGFGAGGVGEAGDGGAAGAPQQCPVYVPDTQPPYALTFKFFDNLNSVWLRSGCGIEYTFTSCDSGFSTPIVVHSTCTVDCSNDALCGPCGPCPIADELVSPTQTVSDVIDGNAVTLNGVSGCQCASYSPLPAGEYQITTPVFNSASEATSFTNPRYVTTRFAVTGSRQVLVDLGAGTR